MMKTSDIDQHIPSAGVYRAVAGGGFNGAFSKTVGAALTKGAKDGLEVVSVNLPRLYRQTNEKGKKLRGAMLVSLAELGYDCSLIDNRGWHYWQEDEDRDKVCESPAAKPKKKMETADEKLLKSAAKVQDNNSDDVWEAKADIKANYPCRVEIKARAPMAVKYS